MEEQFRLWEKDICSDTTKLIAIDGKKIDFCDEIRTFIK